MLTLIFGFVVAAGAANVWLMAALLFSASTFFNAMQPIAHAMLADIAAPEHHGAAFGMNNLIGEIGAVLSPAVSGALRDATGGWAAAVFVDAGADRRRGRCCSCSCARRARAGSGARRTIPAGPRPSVYGVVVDSVNVSVLLYVPVRSASLAPIACLNPSVTGRWTPGRCRSAGWSGCRAADVGERAGVGAGLQRLRQRERAVDELARCSSTPGRRRSASRHRPCEITVAVVVAV